MATLPQPSSVVLEFVTWSVWFTVSLAIQKRLCREYPGVRSVCRMMFLLTAAVAILPSCWTLWISPFRGPVLLAQVAHVFCLGVFAQVGIRALLLLRWLNLKAPATNTMLTERYVMASLLALTQVTRSAPKEQK